MKIVSFVDIVDVFGRYARGNYLALSVGFTRTLGYFGTSMALVTVGACFSSEGCRSLSCKFLSLDDVSILLIMARLSGRIFNGEIIFLGTLPSAYISLGFGFDLISGVVGCIW